MADGDGVTVLAGVPVPVPDAVPEGAAPDDSVAEADAVLEGVMEPVGVLLDVIEVVGTGELEGVLEEVAVGAMHSVPGALGLAAHGSVKMKLYVHIGDSLTHDSTTLALAGLAWHANVMTAERRMVAEQLAPPLYTSLLICWPPAH